MSEKLPSPNEKVPKKFESIDEAVEYAKKLADQIKTRTGKTVVIDIIGIPNSGKSFFIKEFSKRYNRAKDIDERIGTMYTTANYERREEWNTGLKSDYFLIHATDNGASLYSKDFDIPIDIRIFIYNPSENPLTSRPQSFDIIISNSGADKKNKL